MAEEYRDYGQKGIDTQDERDILNYSPSLSYKKDIIPDFTYVDEQRRTYPRELSSAITYSIPAAQEAVERAKKAAEGSIALIADKLKKVSVKIDDPIRGETIRQYADGAETLSFDVFDRACRDDSREARAVAFYFMEKSGVPEALLYPDIIEVQAELEEDCSDLLAGAVELCRIQGCDPEEDIEKFTSDRLHLWTELESRKKDLIAKLGSDISESARAALEIELGEVNRDLAKFTSDPVPTIARLVIDKADSLERISERIWNLASLDRVQMFGDDLSYIVEGVLTNVDVGPLQGYREIISRVKSTIDALRKLISMASVISNLKALNVADVVLSLVSPLLRQITGQVLQYVSTIKVQLVSPALDWLLKASENPVMSLLPLDRLANTIMDVADGIEKRFDDVILDFYRTNLTRFDKISEKLEHVENMKWIDEMCKILDEISAALDSVEPDALVGIVKSKLDPKPYIDMIAKRLVGKEDAAS